ncbi:hypothetical protein K525DRAFT_235131 [Schizophyllum commune Loenen D]|nr:hypothetical protein K525DRAFT_235131 [Schizophyllum commune Loenen D]
MRRLSDGAQRTHGGQALRRLKAEVDDEDKTLIGEDRTFVEEGKSRNHDSPIVKADHKGKGRADPSTPATSSDSRKALLKSKAETDYSKFKGRGRYGKEREREKDAGNTTINSLFEIDRTRNNGADFQFEDVVRGRESRKRLEATDCECCREYYEAVGPLPARPQGPLWRSPSRSPRKHRPECQHHQGNHDQEERRDEEVQAHRQAISRHRQQWARAKTPPGYWEIGFPSTQEVTDMNERAREMHRDKLRVVEAEARKDGGRYRRR